MRIKHSPPMFVILWRTEFKSELLHLFLSFPLLKMSWKASYLSSKKTSSTDRFWPKWEV